MASHYSQHHDQDAKLYTYLRINPLVSNSGSLSSYTLRANVSNKLKIALTAACASLFYKIHGCMT